MKAEHELTECDNCGHPGQTWRTPLNQDLCAPCWEEWFYKDETTPIHWVMQCKCGEVVKGKRPVEQCGCGRVYTAFQLW